MDVALVVTGERPWRENLYGTGAGRQPVGAPEELSRPGIDRESPGKAC